MLKRERQKKNSEPDPGQAYRHAGGRCARSWSGSGVPRRSRVCRATWKSWRVVKHHGRYCLPQRQR